LRLLVKRPRAHGPSFSSVSTFLGGIVELVGEVCPARACAGQRGRQGFKTIQLLSAVRSADFFLDTVIRPFAHTRTGNLASIQCLHIP
jgi:hypothetical protein